MPDDLTDFYILHEGYTLLLGDGNIEEVDYDDVKEKKYSKESSSGFLLIGDKYWMTSIIPPQGRKFRFDLDYTNKYRSSYIDMTGYEISPNSSIQHNVKSLLGAKEISLIDQYAEELQIENLDLIVNYGLMYWVVRPLWVVLDYLFKFTSNYGYSIIILTIFFFSAKFCFVDVCSGMKNKEYSTITAADKLIAARIFLFSTILRPFFQQDHAHRDQTTDYILKF